MPLSVPFSGISSMMGGERLTHLKKTRATGPREKLFSAVPNLRQNFIVPSLLSSYADEEDDEGLEQLPPPRLFCDICDVFDQHDTDDCPTQASSSDSPPHSSYHGARAPGGSDRPYCGNCEGMSSLLYPVLCVCTVFSVLVVRLFFFYCSCSVWTFNRGV